MAGEDVVTDLQNQISHVTAGLFNFVGALQRDAPPASVFDEPIITPPTQNIDVQAQNELMAKELTQALKDLRAAIERLPELDASEEAEAAAAVEQQRRDDVASAALKQRLAGAESKLAHLQRAHGVLADLALQHPANQPS